MPQSDKLVYHFDIWRRGKVVSRNFIVMREKSRQRHLINDHDPNVARKAQDKAINFIAYIYVIVMGAQCVQRCSGRKSVRALKGKAHRIRSHDT